MINANNIKYEIIDLLYDNETARLYKCKYLNNYYIIKCYREKYKYKWQREVNVFSDINDYTNIIQYIGSSSDIKIYSNKYHLIIMEYAKYGDLFEYLSTSCEFFTKETIIRIFLQILNGLKHLNKYGWRHRDLKLENIVITNIKPFQVKIIDFEFTTKNRYSSRSIGTMSYMSPQLLQNLYYDTQKNDIWTLGVIFFSIYTNNRPYRQPKKINDNNLDCKWMIAIKEKRWDEYWDAIENSCDENINKILLDENGNLPQQFKDIIELMLCWEQKDRGNLNTIIKHPFLSKTKSSTCCKCIFS